MQSLKSFQTVRDANDSHTEAVERIAKLHDALRAYDCTGRPLGLLLVRVLFCLFAANTGIFRPAGAFGLWIEGRTAMDGSDLSTQLAVLFRTLRTPEHERSKDIDPRFADFPHVRVGLFDEELPLTHFNAAVRHRLLECCTLDWDTISPAVFGTWFQDAMDAKARRTGGAHYTCEENILKLINPLFLDELRAEFAQVKDNSSELCAFHKKLCALTLLDPACGCGNFLVIAYRELRWLELDVLRALQSSGDARYLGGHAGTTVGVDQCYGIEIEEFPALITRVALLLVDQQMNRRMSEQLGEGSSRIPLMVSPHIVHGNALIMDWNELLPAHRARFVLGNPPFVGKQMRNARQHAELERVFEGLQRVGVLDYVAAWYAMAAKYLSGKSIVALPGQENCERRGDGHHIRCAFVSTSSITQGEQVGVLWSWLLARGIRIQFAHRTFQWSSEANGAAAVGCVIIGFGMLDPPQKTIFAYDHARGIPREIRASNISPYLVDSRSVLLAHRSLPLGNVPTMVKGSMPIDGGHFLFTDEERDAFLSVEPSAKRWIRRLVGAEEFIHHLSRWCLWMVGISDSELRAMPEVLKRVEAVRMLRARSPRKQTRASASRPHLFAEDRQPSSSYLLVPSVSSERREWIPIGFEKPDTIASNLVLTVPNATTYHFAILSSTMHNAWTRAVCGRLEIRFRYSVSVVYNNFPWPNTETEHQSAILNAGQAILDARATHPQATLANLYDPRSMPSKLREAHAINDCAVDAEYGYHGDNSDAARVAFLFDLYETIAQSHGQDQPKRIRGRIRS